MMDDERIKLAQIEQGTVGPATIARRLAVPGTVLGLAVPPTLLALASAVIE